MVRVEIKIFSEKEGFLKSIEDNFIIFPNDMGKIDIVIHFYFHDKL